MKAKQEDDRYLKTLIEPIRICASYKPKMGRGAGAGLSLDEFQKLYRADPFYSWYKSKDSKRQNADIANASTAYSRAYLPCVVVMSTQIDPDIVIRYRNAQWAILIGSTDDGSTIRSTYTFIRDVVGFDLAGFFSRNSSTLRAEVQKVLHALLSV